MTRTTVLIAVRPASLRRVIEYLLGEATGVEVVARVEDAVLLAQRARRLAPDLVLTNSRLLGRELRQRLTELRSSSPAPRVLVLFPDREFAPEARRCGADAALAEEALVDRLLPTVLRLAGGAGRGRSRGAGRSRVVHGRSRPS